MSQGTRDLKDLLDKGLACRNSHGAYGSHSTLRVGGMGAGETRSGAMTSCDVELWQAVTSSYDNAGRVSPEGKRPA